MDKSFLLLFFKKEDFGCRVVGYRSNVTGVLKTLYPVMWNLEKTGG